MARVKRVRDGFSLIEVVIALAVISFALLSTLALLPMGLKTNRISSEETRAVFILTELEADLRNTHPAANGGKSRHFGLALPYMVDANGRVVPNTGLATNTVSSRYSTGLDDREQPRDLAALPASPYQVSVLYTRVPAAGAHAPVEARLVVGWPSQAATDPALLTSPTHVSGFAESYVSFPAP
ncbi:Verru_Chthon cassette protein B [Verrucomicrobium sp. GAS474]|uniref:prepilin-type N-terminal cleavage/methylation domain-containing protein n=1 Tax=Verrucomicrobium sp. GAS474 TaxID=1882831 RepID=UPI00087BCAFC|nr:prepilin-type N-terminal cleavage/methylation domain-containing protein [Verrucomicrobium sp. GAS474]SDT93029.1 Verru_Chthon cassette protein B [Verrucomicrobium sp. GAS474]